MKRLALLVAAVALLVTAHLGAAAPVRIGLSSTGVTGISRSTPLAAAAGTKATGPRANGTAVLPSGRLVTPYGRTTVVDLLPTKLLLSHDEKRLYVTSEGMDSNPHASAYTDPTFNRYVSVLDPATLRRTQHLSDDALHHGLAESPDGKRLFVSEGATGVLGEFTRGPKGLSRTGSTTVGAARYPWGLALSRDGRTAWVGGFSDDTLTTVDTVTRTVLGTAATGNYPTDVQLSPDGSTLYVLNTGLYNQDADDATTAPLAGRAPVTTPPLTVNGYNGNGSSSLWIYDVRGRVPAVLQQVPIGEPLNGTTVVSGSLPSHVAVSPDGRTLAVSASNDDLVELRDARTGALQRRIDVRMIVGGPTGTQPTGIVWSPDGRTLYVAEAGRDAVAVLDAATGAQRALIPTAWYPMALALSKDGRHLYVASAKGFGAGANDVGPAHGADKIGTDTSYIVNRLKGVVQDVDLSAAACSYPTLTRSVLRNNGLVPAPGTDPSGGVVPTSYGTGSGVIDHVVYIVKENRTYDQVFGDLTGTERAQHVAPYSGNVTPNHHAIARQFAISDNHYTTSQTSYDGHYLADSGQSNTFATQLAPLSYANKLPHDRFVTSPENLPEGGFLWNNLARAGKSFRVYGEATYLIGAGPTALNAGGSPTNPLPPALYALGGGGGGFSATYPSQVTQETPVTKGDDEARADDFLRELDGMSRTGQMPDLLQLILPDDHTDGARPGSATPQTYLGENDHALGRIVAGLSTSPFWGSTAVFVVEDDTQDGQDHVDASRSFVLVAGGHVKKGYVSRTHTSTLSVLKTIDLLLGVPPMTVEEQTSTSLTDMFTPTARTDAFAARDNVIGDAVNPSYPSAASTSPAAQAARLMDLVPRGIDKGGPALQQALLLQARAAAAAGSSQVPPQPDVVEHHLDRSSPPALTVRACSAAAPTGAALPQPRPATGSVLPVTGPSDVLAPLGLLLLAAVLGLRSRSARLT